MEQVSNELTNKRLPQNLDAEKAVLGGVFLKENLFPSLLEVLGEDDFYSPVHRTIFEAFQELYRKNEPIDLVTTANELARKGKLDQVGGAVYLADIASSVINAANAMSYAAIVKEKSVQRQLISAATEIIGNCFESDTDVQGMVDAAQASMFKIAEQHTNKKIVAGREIINTVFDQLEKRFERKEQITGVNTGYTQLNAMTAGFQPTDLIIIAARPSMGKTAFVLNLAVNAATQGMEEVPVVIFSLEMSMEQLMQRMLCVVGEVDLKNMRTGNLSDEDWQRLHQSADVLSRAPVYIDDTPALSILELRARCRQLKAERGLGMVIVDYLQLMRGSRRSDSREQEISEISRNLKGLAKELNVPVIALSQLNRKVEERSDRRPMLSDLRESGAIEQDADVIMFIYRDEVYNKESPKKGTAEIIIGKQRNGPVGALDLAFIGSCTKFGDLAYHPEPSEYGVSS